MKVFDCANQTIKGQPSHGLGDRIDLFRLSRGASQDAQAQDAVIAVLEKALDNRFIMLRNASLEGHPAAIPLILVGPSGLTVIHPSSLRGIFRAKGDEWDQMDERRENFRPANPNLIVQAQQQAQDVEAWLKSQAMRAPPPIDSLLIFTDPGIHVEMARPAVRIVQIDAVDRFITGLLQSPLVLSKEEVQTITTMFTRSGEMDASLTASPEKDVFSLRDDLGKKPGQSSITDRIPRGEKAVTTLNKIPFSNRQWYLLGCLVIVNIVILIALVLFILTSYNP
ncbi:MAG: hypothetical protein A2W36_00860 [Chloroflexi bacterium RBG_16_58_14]|nr:MAG: hypothetical protein A2W36_00860 [Chloroflexi bacterium RBG_16_58_14]